MNLWLYPKPPLRAALVTIFLWLPTESWGRVLAYPTFEQIQTKVAKLSATYQQLTNKVIGISEVGLPLSVVRIGRGDKPAVFFFSGHHGDEKIPVVANLAILENFLRISPSSEFDLYFFLVVNPDGYQRHTRFNSQGIDINRDYPMESNFATSQQTSFETQTIIHYLASHPPIAALALHSGSKKVLWPWCHSPLTADHSEIFSELGTKLAQAFRMDDTKPSYFDYPSTGELIDYLYENYNTLAFTLEISWKKNPQTQTQRQTITQTIAAAQTFLTSLTYSFAKNTTIALEQGQKRRPF